MTDWTKVRVGDDIEVFSPTHVTYYKFVKALPMTRSDGTPISPEITHILVTHMGYWEPLRYAAELCTPVDAERIIRNSPIGDLTT